MIKSNGNGLLLLSHQLDTEDLRALQVSICNALENELSSNSVSCAASQRGNVQLVRLLLSTISTE